MTIPVGETDSNALLVFARSKATDQFRDLGNYLSISHSLTHSCCKNSGEFKDNGAGPRPLSGHLATMCTKLAATLSTRQTRLFSLVWLGPPQTPIFSATWLPALPPAALSSILLAHYPMPPNSPFRFQRPRSATETQLAYCLGLSRFIIDMLTCV